MAKLANTPALNAELRRLQESVNAAGHDYDARHPWAVVPHLAIGLKTTRSLMEKIQGINIDDSARAHLLFLLRNKEQEFMTAENARARTVFGGTRPTDRHPRLRHLHCCDSRAKVLNRDAIGDPAPVATELVKVSLYTPEGWNVRQTQTDSDNPTETKTIQTNQPSLLRMR